METANISNMWVFVQNGANVSVIAKADFNLCTWLQRYTSTSPSSHLWVRVTGGGAGRQVTGPQPLWGQLEVSNGANVHVLGVWEETGGATHTGPSCKWAGIKPFSPRVHAVPPPHPPPPPRQNLTDHLYYQSSVSDDRLEFKNIQENLQRSNRQMMRYICGKSTTNVMTISNNSS